MRKLFRFELNNLIPEDIKLNKGAETIWTDYDGDGMMNLYIAFPSPTESEINAVEDGDISLSFLAKNNILFNFIQFKDKKRNYSTNPMEYIIHKHLQGLEDATLFKNTLFSLSEPEAFDSGIGLHLCLIDSNTRILKAQRLVGLSNIFSRKFLMTIIDTFGGTQYEDEHQVFQMVRKIQGNYSTKELLKLATNTTIHNKK